MIFFTRNKKAVALVCTLICVFILQGCTPREIDKNTVKTDTDNNTYTVTVEDYLGRKITISEPVKRIACGYAYVGHVTTMLDRGEDIVAVVGGLQRDKILTSLHPHIKNLPVPFSAGAINIEELLACNPDIIFIRTEVALNESEVSKLDKINIPYIVIDFNSMEEQMKSILTIGKALGAEEKAIKYIDYYKKAIYDTKKISDTIPAEEKVTLYHSVNEATRTDQVDSLPADWINITGAINVSVGEKLKTLEEKTFASLEQIYLWDPDIIIANEIGVPEYILTNEQWAALRAVKENKVYQVPNGISRWGHPGSLETPLAIIWTAKLIYPQYFEHIDIIKETKEYYSSFFNLDLSDEEINRILLGEGMRIPKNIK